MSNHIYCPRCSMTLTSKEDGGRERPACPSCDYIHYGDFSIGCSGVVIREGKALLVQRGWQPFAGSWQIPGGYAEHDEPLSLAVEREVLEEAGIEAKVRDVIAFRHSIGGGIGGPTTNIYVMFRLDPLGNEEPRFDGDEIANAGFFSLEEMETMEAVQGLSKWAIDKALRAGSGYGLQYEANGPLAGRAGWQLFGLQP
ncbi:MAG: NUDIX domain-containing protein [Dehalococcoidia bacterium]